MACRGSFIVLLLVGALLTQRIAAQKGCKESCSSHDECLGELACMNGKCNDDPGVGTHICAGAGDGGATCKPSGSLVAPNKMPGCNTAEMSECCKPGQRYDKYDCSPPITSKTKGRLTLNGFGEGGSGGGKAACTQKYYSSTAKVVALSTGWFANYARCNKTIQIYGNGKSTTAKVVDECDSRAGCDEMHAYQPPCQTDIVDASAAVWSDLGISKTDSRYGWMEITWSG